VVRTSTEGAIWHNLTLHHKIICNIATPLSDALMQEHKIPNRTKGSIQMWPKNTAAKLGDAQANK